MYFLKYDLKLFSNADMSTSSITVTVFREPRGSTDNIFFRLDFEDFLLFDFYFLFLVNEAEAVSTYCTLTVKLFSP